MNLIGKEAVAKQLDISRRTLDRLIAAGEIEHIRVATPTGQRPIIKFSPEAVAEFIKRATVMANA